MNAPFWRFCSDARSLFILSLGVMLLFLPAFLGRQGIFQDDQAMAEFPWHYFLAVHFQQGEIPFWEPHTWCGAIPFYARYYADTWYFPLWPFYLLSRPGDLDLSYWTLSLLPLFLHYLLAGAGMYLFLRRALRLRPLSSLAGGWIYVFSPAFSYSYVWFPIVAVQAWLPFLLLQVVQLDRRPSWGGVARGGIVLGLMSLAAQPPHLGYSLVLAAFLALALSARRLLRGEYAASLRAPLLLAAAVILGVCLSAVYWFSALEGQSYTEQHIDLSYASVAGGDGSLPPLYLATLFSPDLFGAVDGRHIWGFNVVREARYWEANLSGGLLLMFLALVGLCPLARRAGLRRLRFWSAFALFVFLFSLLCVLGRHIPFYRWIFRAVPFLSQFPFPIRYRLLQCAASAWLAGLGTEVLFRAPAWRLSARLVWGFVAVSATVVVLALAWPQDLTLKHPGMVIAPPRPWAFPGWGEMAARHESAWLWLGPVTHYGLAVVLLVLIGRGLRGRRRAAAALGLVLAESAFFAFNAFYFCTFERRFARPEHMRASRPERHPMVRTVLDPLSRRRFAPAARWGSDQPFYDNFARLDGSAALMGYDMKPLERRFKRAIEAAYQKPMDWPIYWANPRPVFVPFLSHFSVGDLMDIRPSGPFASGRSLALEPRPPLYLHENAEALPRVYAQDRIVEASADEQMRELVGGDLRRGVFMIEPPAEAREGGEAVASYRSCGAWTALTASAEEAARFRELQEKDVVSRIDYSRANAVVAECDFSSPAMLIFTDVWYPGWTARVDGRPADLHRVNYCQRGVWLAAGKHRVELAFLPPAVVSGGAVALASWAAVVLLSVGAALRRRGPASAPGRR